jgi:hypothetical protein
MELPRAKIDLLTAGMDGHRRQYVEVLEQELLAGAPELHLKVRDLTVAKASFGSALRTHFHPSMDDYWIRFGCTTLLRALLGRRTVAMFHRPNDCFRKDAFRYRVKRLLFQILSRLPNVEILTVLPFEVDPRFADVATNWIYDLQLWDLLVLDHLATSETPLSAEVRSAAGDRRIVVAFGRQNQSKAFDYFARIWTAKPDIKDRFLFVAAGKVLPDCAASAQAFVAAGGLSIDRYVDDRELFSLYRIADIVWSCYAPQYNMASGIYDRAVQMSVPSIVRSGSLLATFGSLIDHPTLAIPYAEPSAAAELIARWEPARVPDGLADKRAREMRDHSLSVLRRALGLPMPQST